MKLWEPKMFTGLSEADCIQIQQKLSRYVTEKGIVSLTECRTVAGVDIAYWREQEMERAVCCIVVINRDDQAVIETEYCEGNIEFPYIPGCFAFRELPLVLETAEKLHHKPDLYLFDGNGILHPRRMGLATHASFYLNAPTAGVAKHCFRIEGAVYAMPEDGAGEYTDIIKDGRVLGRIIRTHSHVKPVYASVGNYIDIETVTRLVLQLTGKESHIPVPTRFADLETHRMREKIRSGTRDTMLLLDDIHDQ